MYFIFYFFLTLIIYDLTFSKGLNSKEINYGNSYNYFINDSYFKENYFYFTRFHLECPRESLTKPNTILRRISYSLPLT